MKFGVLQFPGSNCDYDAYYVIERILGHEVRYVWHKDHDISDIDCIIVPGGFSYGDYLRSGAIARFSPIMTEVVKFAAEGRPVIGICNGFQILLESHLLPGAMQRNASLKFICQDVDLRVETTGTPFTRGYEVGQVIRIPIAHADGNYIADPDTLKMLEDTGRIVFRYCDEKGSIADAANPNGSVANIAGIVNEKGNVLGMMPHPERYSEDLVGGHDGLRLFESICGMVHV